MARANSVLPVPGGPTIKTPRGILPPSLWNLVGSRRKSTISAYFFFRFFNAGHVAEVDVHLVLAQQPSATLAEGANTTATTALHLPHEINPDKYKQQNGSKLDKQNEQQAAVFRFGP